MDRIRAVLFDAGGTLWHTNSWKPEEAWHQMIVEFGHDCELDAVKAAFAAQWKQAQPDWLVFETSGNEMTTEQIDEFFRTFDAGVLNRIGIADDGSLVERILQWFQSQAYPKVLFPETIDVLAEIRQRGYPMAVVSNGYRQKEDSSSLGIEHFFETIIGSAHVGYVKPMPEIYHMALDALDIQPTDGVMVGDRYEPDVAGPEAVGIRGIHLVRDGADSPAERVIQDLWGVLNHLGD